MKTDTNIDDVAFWVALFVCTVVLAVLMLGTLWSYIV